MCLSNSQRGALRGMHKEITVTTGGIIYNGKEKVDLWKPAERPKVELNEITYAQCQDVITKIFRKVAKDDYGIEPHEFEVTYEPGSLTTYKLLGGPRVYVIWGLFPLDKAFDESMRNCLRNIKKVKTTVAVDSLASINERSEWYDSFKPDVKPVGACDVECYMVVKVVHHKTGLVSSRQGKLNEKTWARLIGAAKQDIANVLAIIEGKGL